MSSAECTSHCRSKGHASELIAVVTSSASEEQIKDYIASHCHRGGQICDGIGRTALHVAASCGKGRVLEWLLAEGKADKQAKDAESGWTPLHRSIFYGQLICAVKLIQFGSSMKSSDFEDLTPIELAVKDRLPHIDHSPDNPCDVYTWGTNSNFTLGHSHQQSRATPDVVDELLKRKINVRQVCFNKFHSVFLATNGRVFTCGHGQGGRLGQGDEETCLRPSLVQGLTGTCTSIAAARDHTLFQMEDGSIYGCGENKFGQLGISSGQENYLTPRQILNKFFFSGMATTVVAAKFHSVFYTEDQVFTCGLNDGQLGHAKDIRLVSAPKLVTTLNHAGMAICQVAASDGITACRTENGDIYLLQNFICRKIINKQLSINKMVVISGTLDTATMKTAVTKQKVPVTMVLLHKSGRLLSWQSTDGTLRRCVTNRWRQIFYTDVALSNQGLLLATTEGEAFRGRFTHKKTASLYGSSKLNTESSAKQGFILIGGVERVDREKSELINIQRVSCLHRVTRVACDPKGLNFAALQNIPRLGLTDLPEVSSGRLTEDLKRLYAESSAADNIHDVEITVGLQLFPAHKLILAHRSEYFKKLLMKSSRGFPSEEVSLHTSHLNRTVVSVNMTTTNPEVLKRILTYIYTSSCDVFDWNFVDNVTNRERALLGKRSQNINGNIQKGKKEKGGKKKKKKKTTDEGTLQDCEPEYVPVMHAVKEVRDSAKTFGIPSLYHRLELVRMHGSRLDNFRAMEEQSGFNRSEYETLSDIVLESEDGALFQCHRCILVSRLEYFNSMLASDWLEASCEAPLQLPIPADVLAILLDFVYTSRAPTLERCPNMELVCNVLVTSDHLLLPRLKEITETKLVDMISLRNVSQLLEFASMYQAHQLRAACHQFITVNIVYLLESHSLDILSDDVMIELTKAFREMVPGMSGRVITPYSSAPTPDELVQILQDTGPLSVDVAITSAKSRRKERRKSSISQSSETEITISESRDGDAMEPAESLISDEIISDAKARRKARRRSSEKFSRSSEVGDKRLSETLSEESGSTQTPGPAGDSRGSTGGGSGSAPSRPQPRLVQLFESNREKWMEVNKPGNKKRVNCMKGTSHGEGVTSGDRVNAVNSYYGDNDGRNPRSGQVSGSRSAEHLINNESTIEGNNAVRSAINETMSNLRRLNGASAKEGTASRSLTEEQPLLQSSHVAQSTQEQLPGDGQWMKKGQKVIMKSKPIETRTTTPLSISVHPWQSPPPAPVQGTGLKDIMAAEMAMMQGTPSRISPTIKKRSQVRSGRSATMETKPVWSGWAKPVSLALPEEQPGSAIQGDSPLSSRKIRLGEMFESRNSDADELRNIPSISPVSPSSPDQSSVWGASMPSPRTPEPKSLSFTQIIQAEELAERNLDKALNKSLQSIQLEEQAMQELLQTYQLAADNEEYITVEQVKIKLANPHWSKIIT